MSMRHGARRESIVRAVYRSLLRLFPLRFRRVHGESMERLFLATLRHAPNRPARLAVCCGAIIDIAVGVLAERSRVLASTARRFGAQAIYDARYATRVLWRSPTTTVLCSVTMAFGIGATTLVFSVVRAVVLEPLPYPEPHRLVRLGEATDKDARFRQTSMPNYLDWRAAPVFADTAAYYPWRRTFTGGEIPERLRGAAVTPSYFSLLGAETVLGRGFTAGEGVEGEDRILVLGHTFWQQALGGDLDVVGRDLVLDGEPYRVIGVLAPGMDHHMVLHWGGGSAAPRLDVWQPIAAEPRDFWRRRARFLRVFARLQDGVTVAQAHAAMETLGTRLASQYPDENAGRRIAVAPLLGALAGRARQPLALILAAATLVMLIGCVNVSNLLLARASARRSEFAVREALGASRARLVRQSLSESLVLALWSGTLGIGVALLLKQLVTRFGPSDIPRLHDTALDGSALAVVLGASVMSAILFGLAPALGTSRRSLAVSSRGWTPRGSRTLVACEAGLALLLTITAGLFITSFLKLSTLEPGYDPEGIVQLRMVLPRDSSPADRRRTEALLLNRARTVTGVRSADASTMSLLASGSISAFLHADANLEATGGPPQGTVWPISPGYTRSLRIELLAGRSFASQDRSDSLPVALVSNATARALFDRKDPLGRQVRLDSHLQEGDPTRTIVGVVADVHWFGVAQDAPLQVLVPRAQWTQTTLILTLRIDGQTDPIVAEMRRIAARIVGQVPIHRVDVLEDALASSIGQPRFFMLALGILAIGALLLATGGIYGVLSYAVSRRRREIAVHMVLGARTADVLRLVVRGGMLPAVAGMAVGIAAAFLLRDLLASQLYGVDTLDLGTTAASSGMVALAALAACLLPARRAARVDPAVNLAAE